MIDYSTGLKMAKLMKQYQGETILAIEQTKRDQHGVVALRFNADCSDMTVEILDELYDGDVRIYPPSE